jgi:hypothetical protein
VKRSAALLLGLVILPFLGSTPPAHATGGAACTISGTLTFSPASDSPARGVWSIEPGVINCEGLFRSKRVITGPGGFTGTGTYTEVSAGSGTCLHNVGTGTVDYIIPTSEANNRIQEPHDFVLAGAGVFTTPSLRGSFQVTPPYDGDCLTRPVIRATFVAEAVMIRFDGLDH